MLVYNNVLTFLQLLHLFGTEKGLDSFSEHPFNILSSLHCSSGSHSLQHARSALKIELLISSMPVIRVAFIYFTNVN